MGVGVFRLFYFITVWLFSSFTNAGTPLFSLTPLTPTTIQVSTQGVVSVQYRVENQSYKPHTLVMVPISGITQITSAGNFTNPFVLQSRQSCTLTLQVSGNGLTGSVHSGPKVCQQAPDGGPSPFLCYQPSAVNSLNITYRSNPIPVCWRSKWYGILFNK